MTFAPVNSQGAYLPQSEIFSDEIKRLKVQLDEIFVRVARIVNAREIGQYETVALLTGQQWFDPANAQKKRSIYRRVYTIGAIAPGATSTTAHGITGLTAITRRSAEAITGVVDYRPIPYVSATAVTEQISFICDPTSIIIVNGTTAPAITSAIVVLEYLLN